MRKLARLMLLAIAVASVSAQEVDQVHAAWIRQVMHSISTIKPGMTRKDLFAIFAEDGGLSIRTRGRYVYKQCPYIKVEVEFELVDKEHGTVSGMTLEDPADKIVRVSRPYLEYPFMD
jgi:hypothetical protein